MVNDMVAGSNVDSGPGWAADGPRNMAEHARFELARRGEDPGFSANLVATVAVFASWGHSGSSRQDALDLLVRLLNGEALSGLTDDPSEWIDRSEMSGTPMWQSARDSRAMSTDGGRTYTLVGVPGQVHRTLSAGLCG